MVKILWQLKGDFALVHNSRIHPGNSEARTGANVTSMSRNRWQMSLPWAGTDGSDCLHASSATSLLLMWSRTPKPKQWWYPQRKVPHTTINVIKTTPHRDHQKPFSQVILDVKLIIKITHPMGICVIPSLLHGWLEPNCKPRDWAASIPNHWTIFPATPP